MAGTLKRGSIMHRDTFRPALMMGTVSLTLLALSGPASAKSINTYNSWDGNSSVIAFGCPNTTTYGQVIQIPAGMTKLTKFTFSWKRLDNGASLIARGEVYAWDGLKATGSALWESKKRKISYQDFIFHEETFKTSGIPVTPGAKYVIFASIDKEYESCTNNYTLGWGSVDDSAYTKGTFVLLNSGGDESQWTTMEWSLSGVDLAFKAMLSP